eukprot:428519-Pelagomonas_calceolata.AAC.3
MSPRWLQAPTRMLRDVLCHEDAVVSSLRQPVGTHEQQLPAMTRLQTYNENVNSVLGFYTGVLSKVRGKHVQPKVLQSSWPCASVLLTSCSASKGLRRPLSRAIDGTRSMDEVFRDIMKVLDAKAASMGQKPRSVCFGLTCSEARVSYQFGE